MLVSYRTKVVILKDLSLVLILYNLRTVFPLHSIICTQQNSTIQTQKTTTTTMCRYLLILWSILGTLRQDNNNTIQLFFSPRDPVIHFIDTNHVSRQTVCVCVYVRRRERF